ncbi:MAG: malonyl-ACP O-methyltransferase BioC [Steroidobacteraceae bacterium]
MSEPPGFVLDRRALARAFNRAAAGYDAAAWLQRLARAELIERLPFFALQPRTVLDLGAGTCQASAELLKRYPHARVLALDLAVEMLAAAPRRRWPRRRLERLCADAHALPLADQSVDLIYSSLMLQWSDRPDRLFVELARVLRPDGLLAFVSFGPDSLQELRDAWGEADRDMHVSEFPDMPQLGAALVHAGFVEPVMDVERHRRDYPDADALMRELKRIGAHNAAAARPRGLTGRARMGAMRSAYERLRTAGGLPATFQLLFGVAFRGRAAVAGTHPGLPDGEYAVPVAQLRRRDPHRP